MPPTLPKEERPAGLFADERPSSLSRRVQKLVALTCVDVRSASGDSAFDYDGPELHAEQNKVSFVRFLEDLHKARDIFRSAMGHYHCQSLLNGSIHDCLPRSRFSSEPGLELQVAC